MRAMARRFGTRLVSSGALAAAALFLAAPGASAQQAKPVPIGQQIARPITPVPIRPLTVAPRPFTPVPIPKGPVSLAPTPLRVAPIHVAPPVRVMPEIGVSPMPMQLEPPVPAFRLRPKPESVRVLEPLGILASPMGPIPIPLIRAYGLPSPHSPQPNVVAPRDCDPMSELLGTGNLCIAPYVFGLFSADGFGWNRAWLALQAAETYGAFGSVWPSLTVPLCTFCNEPIAGPSGPAIPVDPGFVANLVTPLGKSRLLAEGIVPGLTPYPERTPQSPAELLRTSKTFSPSGTYGSQFLFVLQNGTTDLVAKYWLGEDWLLHYVTVSGERKAIPVQQLNIDTTARVNYARGVVFWLPAWPEPTASPHH